MSTASAVHVSVEEYLSTVYEPDCEWVDGQLVERNVGKRNHSILQREFIIRLGQSPEIRVFPEQRIRIAAGCYRIPDVCAYLRPAPAEPVFERPPFLVIEILSDEDRMSRVRQKIDEYLEFGVAYVWVIDPELRIADVYTSAGFFQAKDLMLRTQNPEIVVPLAGIFAALDEDSV